MKLKTKIANRNYFKGPINGWNRAESFTFHVPFSLSEICQHCRVNAVTEAPTPALFRVMPTVALLGSAGSTSHQIASQMASTRYF